MSSSMIFTTFILYVHAGSFIELINHHYNQIFFDILIRTSLVTHKNTNHMEKLCGTTGL